MDELLFSQAVDQAERYCGEVRSMPPAQRMEFIRTQTLGAVSELMEVLDETGWKPWRKSDFGAVDRERYIAELSDVFIFIANLACAVGCSGAELAAAIRKTQLKNQRRIEEGY